ncbi:MAG: hypothetical protein WBE37_08845 [Bryobacteraceae bacterium]
MPLAAAPTITSVENAASNNSPGLPNAGIAQGAIFIVYGSGLGPANLATAASAFQSTTLSNTSVAVTVGGTTVNALMYYTSASQVAALLPSDTPTGTGTVTVTYNNQTSATAPITVVANNLGIFTVGSSGQGPGIVTYSDYSLVSPVKAANCGGPNTTCGAANPGDTLILWATGLGPVTGSDASGAGLGVNMPDIPLKVFLGGVQAQVSYQGRSGCCIGEDQIVFTVPDNVPTGCAVPLLVQIGNEISNNTVMPVADGSRSCTTVIPEYAQVEQAVLSGAAVTSGAIKLAHFSDGGGTFEDDGKFQFQNILGVYPGTAPFLVEWVDIAPLGTCLVYGSLNASWNEPVTGVSQADAGSSFTVQGPNGSVMLQPGSLSEFNSQGSFLVPGAYTATGTGGTEIGPFTANITLPPAMTLVTPVNNATVTRSNGLTVTWTGGIANEYLQIEVNSPADASNQNGASAICTVAGNVGTLTIPAYVLLALPATPSGTSAGLVLSSVILSPFTATGMTIGAIQTYTNEAGFGYGWGSGGLTLK